MTRIVLEAVRQFGVDVSEIHEDTTSVKVFGAYSGQKAGAVQLKRGHSRVKQLNKTLPKVSEGEVTVTGKVPAQLSLSSYRVFINSVSSIIFEDTVFSAARIRQGKWMQFSEWVAFIGARSPVFMIGTL